MIKTSKTNPIEDLTYEQAFSELEKIVSRLETEQRPLDEAMKLFERGQILIKRCTELIDQVELKVRELSGETLTEGVEIE